MYRYAGRCWIESLELTMKCAAFLQRQYAFDQSDSLQSNASLAELSNSSDSIDVSTTIPAESSSIDSEETSKTSRGESSPSNYSRNAMINDKMDDQHQTVYIAAPAEELNHVV
jgi:hypothetical protein